MSMSSSSTRSLVESSFVFVDTLIAGSLLLCGCELSPTPSPGLLLQRARHGDEVALEMIIYARTPSSYFL